MVVGAVRVDPGAGFKAHDAATVSSRRQGIYTLPRWRNGGRMDKDTFERSGRAHALISHRSRVAWSGLSECAEDYRLVFDAFERCRSAVQHTAPGPDERRQGSPLRRHYVG